MRLAITLAALLLASCATGTPSSSAVGAAVAASLGTNDVLYRQAIADLNGDSQPEAMVLVQDPRWCGSGGCVLLVFRASPNGYSLVSRSTVTAAPIRILQSTHSGWRDLIVRSNGTGDVVLQFNGSGYPSNPSLEPAATPTQLHSAQIVIDPAPNNSFKPKPLRGSA